MLLRYGRWVIHRRWTVLLLVVLATQLIGDWLRIRLDPQLRNL